MKKQTISKKLFTTYGIAFSISISLLSLFFVVYVVSDLNKKIIATQEQMVFNINKNIESFFEEANSFSMSLINSIDFRSITLSSLPEAYEKGEHLGAYFMDLYLIAYQMIQKDYSVSIYTNRGYYIWLGDNYFIQKVAKDEKLIYKNYDYIEIQRTKENKYCEEISLSEPIKRELATEYISLKRTMNIHNKFYSPQAFIEIQIEYEKLERLMSELMKTNTDMSVMIYNKKGQILYGEEKILINEYMEEGELVGGEYYFNRQHIRIEPLLTDNIYAISVVPALSLYSRVGTYLISAIFLIAIVNVLLMGITYKISIKLIRPIEQMCNQVKNIRLDRQKKVQLEKVETDVEELDFLALNISELHNQLQESLEKVVKLEGYELQSKMLALQAQMQPHFLYNTLMTIGAMGEEYGNQDVANMCYNMTNMLRYISSKDTSSVTLADEVNHVESYLNIMKERFHHLKIDYDIPLEMMGIEAPKLIIQPLVENSIKYCEKVECIIEICGIKDQNKWRIQIKDNGKGFQEEVLESIARKCEDVTKEKRQLEIKGMGIANIYMRLKLFYGESFYFKITNNTTEGCTIELGNDIGGRYKCGKEMKS